MTNGTNTVVTSMYELNYEKIRGGAVYKSFSLLTETIQNLIFDEFNYVIYTDKKTYDKHDIGSVFGRENVKIKIKELNSSFYLSTIDPIRRKWLDSGEIYERIHCVKNYMEVILNKVGNLLDESVVVHEEDSQDMVVWLDAGLFGTSCHNAWRDYMKDNLCYRKRFLDKIFQKVDEGGFIATKGNGVAINYEVVDHIKGMTGVDIKLVPGCLFGGTKKRNNEILSGYLPLYIDIITSSNRLISEQELLSVLTDGKDVVFYEFDDWEDLQRAFLKILDVYDENLYKTDSCSEYVADFEK